MTSLPPILAAELLAWLGDRDTQLTDIPVIQPADPFLDMIGESLRGRIFLTESETGQTLCLRPEFTIPVCRDHVMSGVPVPKRYAYLGEVFRQRRAGGDEFFQAGIEDIGDTDIAGADARSLGEAYGLVKATAPSADWHVTLGDQAVFEATVSALGLPKGWRLKLARAFGANGQLDNLIEVLGQPRSIAQDLPDTVSGALEKGDAGILMDAVAGEMEKAGFTAASGRLPGEIAARLIEQTALARARLTPEEIAILREFLGIRLPLVDASAALRAFAIRLGEHGRNGMDKVIAAFEARVEKLAAMDIAMDAFTYDASFGRPLDYYTGLVFEVAVKDRPEPVIGGGRYDRLLTLLGAKEPVPGVGFSVWLDRLEAVRKSKSGKPAGGEGAS